MRTLKLSVVEGPDAPISITFQGQNLSIGRAKTSDLVLGDTQVSRQHAEIIREGPDFVLVDLARANGTFVGAERKKITRHTLVDGDVVRIGRDVLEASVTVAEDVDATELQPASDPDVTVTELRPKLEPALVIKIVAGPDQGKVFVPNKNRIEIGRLPSCDVRLNDAGVSRLHATIRREGGRFMIYDENSANGIETPGSTQRVSVAELHDGMVLRFSETEVEIQLASTRSNGAGIRVSAARRR